MSLVATIVVTVSASLTADATWYSIGRWCGAHTVTPLGKLWRLVAARVKVAERRFAAHQLGFLFASRFVPEINPLAAGMAGATRIPPGRYFAIVTVSALVWAVAWTGAGYALGNVATGLPTPFGIVTTVIVLAAAIAAIGFALKRRSTSEPWECLGDRRGDMELDGVTGKPAHAQQHRDRGRLEDAIQP